MNKICTSTSFRMQHHQLSEIVNNNWRWLLNFRFESFYSNRLFQIVLFKLLFIQIKWRWVEDACNSGYVAVHHWALRLWRKWVFVIVFLRLFFSTHSKNDCSNVHVNCVHANSLSEEMRWLRRKWRNFKMRIVNYVAIWLVNRCISIGSCTCDCSDY